MGLLNGIEVFKSNISDLLAQVIMVMDACIAYAACKLFKVTFRNFKQNENF